MGQGLGLEGQQRSPHPWPRVWRDLADRWGSRHKDQPVLWLRGVLPQAWGVGGPSMCPTARDLGRAWELLANVCGRVSLGQHVCLHLLPPLRPSSSLSNTHG